MTNTNPTTDKELVIFVLEQIQELGEYLKGINEYDFYNNNMLKDACLMKLLAIGEYTKRMSNYVKETYTNVEWRLIAQARNFYAHGYGATEWTRVWETLDVEIPRLKVELQIILNDL